MTSLINKIITLTLNILIIIFSVGCNDTSQPFTHNPEIQSAGEESGIDFDYNLCVGDYNLSIDLYFLLFSKNKCTEIDGNLYIKNTANLAIIGSLQNLRKVSGDVHVEGNVNFDLSNLRSLEEIGGSLNITNNDNLSGLQGLNNLDRVFGDIIFKSNTATTRFLGFEGLSNLLGSILIEGNDDLEVVQGFINLEYVTGDIIISDNPSLHSVEAFDNIQKVRVLGLWNNKKLTTISHLKYLNELYRLDITNNDSLIDLNWLWGLGIITDFISITNNDNLKNLRFFESPTEAEFECLDCRDVVLNRAFVNLNENLPEEEVYWLFSQTIQCESDIYKKLDIYSYKPKCEIATGDINVSSIEEYHGLLSLENIRILNGSLIVGELDVESFSVPEGLVEILGDLKIADSLSIKYLSGFDNLSKIYGDLNITNNRSLEMLPNFDMLTDLAGLKVAGNTELSTLSGFNSLLNLEMSLSISNNDTLQSIDGFNGIDIIKGDLLVEDNQNLIILNGFDNLNSIEGSKTVRNNNKLQELGKLQSILSNGDVLVENNDLLFSI